MDLSLLSKFIWLLSLAPRFDRHSRQIICPTVRRSFPIHIHPCNDRRLTINPLFLSFSKTKWNSSSGPSTLSTITTSLPPSIQTRAATLTSSFLSPRHFRPLTSCLGIGEQRPYYLETVPTLAIDRLRTNLRHYYLNYTALAAVLFALTLLVSPTSIISLAILAAAWAYALKVTGDEGVLVAGFLVTRKIAGAVMTVVTFFALLYVLSSIFWYSLTISGVCILSHSGLRDSTMVGGVEDGGEMDGDLEDVPFLNAKTGNEAEEEGEVEVV